MNRKTFNGHILYQASDFTGDDVFKRDALYVHVVEGGLAACKVCGEFEAGLDDTCAEVQRRKSATSREALTQTLAGIEP